MNLLGIRKINFLFNPYSKKLNSKLFIYGTIISIKSSQTSKLTESTEKSKQQMEVIKRNGTRQKVSFDKILNRIEEMKNKLMLKRIDTIQIAQRTVQGLCNGITTEELDFYAANVCAEKMVDDPEYNKLASGICVSNIHKSTDSDFMIATNKLFNNVDKTGEKNPLVCKRYYDAVSNNIDRINGEIDFERDYLFDFFAIKTLEKSYLIRLLETTHDTHDDYGKIEGNGIGNGKEKFMRKTYGKIIERPQHLIMRVAIGIHFEDIESAIETYHLISNHYFIHASPTLYNAGSLRPQMSSCFLFCIGDSIEGIYGDGSIKAAKISKTAGGIGIFCGDIRASGSIIRGTNGISDGLVPVCKFFNQIARGVNQGGRRNGAIAIYIEPWHSDVFAFCDLRKNTGTEELRARDIFLALWIPDLFMERVRDDGMWSLMCPDECRGLTDTYGEEFNELYQKYETEGKYRRQVSAKELWFHILSAQIETGMPYMLYKDNANKQSNQKNLGTIKSSNLCSEIIQYSDTEETSVCNLASICLPRFVKNTDGAVDFDYDELCNVSKVITRNLNKIIDLNYYPVEGAKMSNFKHRPIGVGVQGLADVFCMMKLPFDSEKARVINRKIFETIYFGCLSASNELAKEHGKYDSFDGSPFSEGKLQFHLWDYSEDDLLMGDKWDWKKLIEDIKKYGTRNSLLTTIMPTASTSQIMNNNEAIEPYTSNLYTRTTLAGEYIIVNKHLQNDLIELGLWTKEIREEFFFDNGSIQKIREIPEHIKDIYKTAFEMKSKPLVQQSIERGPFIDQSQSMNIFSNEPDNRMLTSSHFYGWKNKLKTGMYYLRSQPAVDPIKFGIDQDVITKITLKRNGMGVVSEIKEAVFEDPRKVSEIEEQRKMDAKRARSKFKDCEMCSA